jgi:hypothetical protein
VGLVTVLPRRGGLRALRFKDPAPNGIYLATRSYQFKLRGMLAQVRFAGVEIKFGHATASVYCRGGRNSNSIGGNMSSF